MKGKKTETKKVVLPPKPIVTVPKPVVAPVAPVKPVVVPTPAPVPVKTPVLPPKPVVTAPVKIVVPNLPVVVKAGVKIAKNDVKPVVYAMSGGRPVRINSWHPIKK